jgi:sarcosine/dimethylglycine N-methyltransferase
LTNVRELYEFWGAESYAALEAELGESRDPRGRDWLFELFASLGPRAGDVVVDIGARDGKHLRRLVQEHGVEGIALDPVPQADDVLEGTIEELPLADSSADWIWCRDVLVHVNVERGLGECARVLKPGGRMLAYATLATDLLEPREAAWIMDACALATLDGARIEAAAAAAGLELAERAVLGGEWRERMIEEGEWDANEALLRVSRLRRLGVTGSEPEAYAADKVWGVYQLLGKLCPTVYLWERRV